MTRRFRLHLLAGEHGQSLVLTLLVLTFLAVSLGTVIFFTAGNQRNSNLQKAQQTASSLAEAGVNNAVSVLANPANANYLTLEWNVNGSDTSVLPDGSAAHPASTAHYPGCAAGVACVKWWGTVDSSWLWTLYGQATVPNPTGGAAIVKEMSAQVQVSGPPSNGFNVGVWNSVYSPGTGQTCDTSINQGVTINVPLYVGGNLCMANQGGVNAPVYVGGNLNISNKQAFIGCAKVTSNSCATPAPVNSAHVGGWCEGPSGTPYSPCKSEPMSGGAKDTNIYVTNPTTWVPGGAASDFADITAPKICWSGSATEVASGACTNEPPGGWYTFSSPGPKNPCDAQSTGSPLPTFESAGSTTMDRSVTSVFNLTPSTAYSCVTPQGGELAWDPTSRTLTVVGTIFFDGSITMTTTSNQPVKYNGIGSCTAAGSCQSVIYASGDITITSEKLCAVISGNDCDWNNWDPNAKLLIFASDGLTGVSVGPSQTEFQGGLYAANTVSTGQGAQTEGPLVSGTKTVIVGQQFGGTFPPITIAPWSINQQPGGFTISPPMNLKYCSKSGC